jgi:hypothetical protein
MGEGFLLGSDHYYNLDQTWAQNHPTPQYAARVFQSNEMLRLMGYPPTVLELPGGSAADWPPLTAKDALTAYFTNLALGMKGHNYYVFSGGPNPPGAGSTTDSYDYGAGIGAEGEIRPLYRAQKEFGAFIQAHLGFLEASRAYDCRLGFDFDQSRLAHAWRDATEGYFSYARAGEFLRSGVLTSALCASISPALCDLGSDDWLNDTGTPLVVVCASSMATAKQQRLVRFLQEGGRAVFAPVLPVLDENFEPCTLLADALQLAIEPASKHSLQRLCIGPVNNIMGRANWIASYPAGARVLGSDALSGRPVACHIPLGKGGAVFLGMEWLHAKREHEQMLHFILDELDLRQKVACSNPNLWTALWQWEGGSLLFILNLLTAPMTARIQFQGLRGWVDAGTHNVPPVKVTCLVYNKRDEKV